MLKKILLLLNRSRIHDLILYDEFLKGMIVEKKEVIKFFKILNKINFLNVEDSLILADVFYSTKLINPFVEQGLELKNLVRNETIKYIKNKLKNEHKNILVLKKNLESLPADKNKNFSNLFIEEFQNLLIDSIKEERNILKKNVMENNHKIINKKRL